MLTSEVYTPQEAIEEIDEVTDALEAEADELDEESDQYAAIQSRIDRFSYYRNGLEWAREEWAEDVEIELGALTAGEKALMHREAPKNAAPEEMKLWYVAATTERGPYAEEDLTETFNNVANLHPGFVAWAEAMANGLSVFGGPEGNADRSST